MPIDWARIAALFQARMAGQRLALSLSFERVSLWLKKRVKKAEELELRRRGYPSIWFYNEAVTLYIDEPQHGTLVTEAGPGVGESFRRAGAAFVSGVGWIGTAVEQELILPRLFATLNGILTTILESIERFMVPTPAMFDPRQRQASDLFGLFALAGRASTGSIAQIQQLVVDAGRARDVLRRDLGALASAPGDAHQAAVPGAASGPVRSLPEQLDAGARILLGAILLLPILPQVITFYLQAASVRVRFGLLALYGQMEAAVFRIRRGVLQLFAVTLPDFLADAIGLLMAIETVMTLNVTFLARFVQEYSRQLLSTISTFTHDLAVFVNFCIDVVNTLLRIIDAVLDFDLIPVIISAMTAGLGGLIWDALRASGITLPRFTVSDLLSAGANGARVVVRELLLSLISRARSLADTADYIPFVDMSGILFRLDAADELVRQLFQAPRTLPPETAAFSLPTSFPNIYDAFFPAGTIPGLRRALDNTRRATLAGLGGVLQSGVDLLSSTADSFDAARDDAAAMGAPAAYARIASDADAAAEAAFGPQVRDLRAQATARSRDAIVRAFEDWLARGGFQVIGTAIPLYVTEMDRYWREQTAAGTELTVPVTPTSPRILRRRARLSRVQMNSLTIRAEGRALTDDLVQQIAARFQQGISDAYRTGRTQLESAGVE